ncbi:alpha-isopropylmalate synthase regulatory domain-containing protein [Flavilitoribacter nigricans]|nr:alpha-isopropylmalate synthase regulatory domain-containing protein [Flavilitoribacter nigricans]
MQVTIMDTTLRDGEQTSGVSFTESEKLQIAHLLLEELGVDRLEIASAHVSAGEFRAVKKITDWAAKNGYLDQLEILGFVDGDRSLRWIEEAGGRVINLLCKGSRKHCEQQLRKSAEEHLSDIREVLASARQMGIIVNIYLEDWSNGMRDSMDYVFQIIEGLRTENVNRFMLPDTLGILNPDESFDFCKKMRDQFPDLHFDFHAHNDYDLATANVYAALKAGINGIHTTLNGLGERAGNVPLSSVVGVAKDHLGYTMNVDEKKLYSVCKMIESFSGVRIPANKPLIGEFVFTQTSGIHADGDNKANLYHNALQPERFNRKRTYALGKLAGKASIKKNLEELGIELDVESMKKLTRRINELGDRKEMVTKEDLPYIISDVLNNGSIEQHIKIRNYSLSVAAGLRSVATLSIEIEGRVYEETASGDGQYDAFMNALHRIYDHLKKPYPQLIDYAVSIPPGGKTDALCHTVITWEMEGRQFKTNGLDSDQALAAIKATIKMLNLIEQQ